MLGRTHLTAMDRGRIHQVIIWMLALLTVGTLLLRFPGGNEIAQAQALLVIFALLTLLAIYFSPILGDGELSSAHVVGMIAILSLPAEVHSAALWAVALGGLAGGVALLARSGSLRPNRRTLYSVITVTAQVSLSFFVAGEVYKAVGGRVPLARLDGEIAAPLVVFFATYLLIYFAIFLLRAYVDGLSIKRMLASSWAEIATVLTLPVPFALLGAEVYDKLSGAAFVILIVGIALTVLGQYGISRAQRQLRKQVDELRSLSVISQVVSANLRLETLLNIIYLQVAQLLDTDHFLVALYERDSDLTYPLVIRAGQPGTTHDVIERHSGLLRYMMQTQEPLLISSVEGEARQMSIPVSVPPFASWLGVPLLSGGRLLGAIAVSSEEPERQFTPDDLRLLNIVAASASIAIENAQLYQQQTNRANELARLNNVISLLTNTLSPETVLDTVISSGSILADASAVAVYLFDDDHLKLVRCAGLSESFAADPPELLLALLHHDLKSNQPHPLVVSDVNADPLAEPLRPRMNTEGKLGWVELPLFVAGAGLGVICLYSTTPRVLSHEQVELLRAFANQVAQVIRNARQYELTDESLARRVGQLLTLGVIGHELTGTMDEDRICQLVLTQALDATRAESGVVILADRFTEIPRMIAYRGDVPQLGAHPLMGQMFHRSTPYVSSDITPEARYTHLSPSTRSQLVAPIQRSSKNLGILVLESKRANAFSEDDIQFISLLANQAVIALDNARLFHHIAEARDRVQVILDTMSEAIILIDREGIIALVNPRVDLIGLQPEHLLARYIDDVLEQPDLDFVARLGFRSDQDVHKLIKELRAEHEWAVYEPHSYALQLNGSTSYVQRQVIPVRGPSGQIIGVLLVFYDETEQRVLEQAREDLSRMIIHDLRSPLAAVTTSLKLLTDIIPSDSELKPVVQTTTEAGRRAVRKLMSRVDSLLDVARMESGQMYLERRSTELATLVDSVCIELSPLAHELNVKLQSLVPDNLPPLEIDPDKVERVLLNLLDNALKFSPSDTMVTITTQTSVVGASGGFIRIHVIDQGPGVPDEYKQTLFDRFVEVKGRVGRRRGTGLGLTFCRLVVEAHGGAIWIEDNPQGGSIFAFTLPLLPVDEAEILPDQANS